MQLLWEGSVGDSTPSFLPAPFYTHFSNGASLFGKVGTDYTCILTVCDTEMKVLKQRKKLNVRVVHDRKQSAVVALLKCSLWTMVETISYY